MEDFIKWAVIGAALCLLSLKLSGQLHAEELPMEVRIVACESAGRTSIWGDDHKSYGIAQFQRTTFRMFKRESGMDDADWRNPYDQLIMLRWALRHGKGHHWTCYRKIKSGEWHISKQLDSMMRRNMMVNLAYGG